MLDKIYNNSPVFFQNFIISLYGYYWKNRRYGGAFKKYVKIYKERESFTQEEWRAFQTGELRHLLCHAFENVPFYQEKYSNSGFTINDFKNFEIDDLPKLPYLEKDELRNFGTSTLLSQNKAKGKFYNSSGSTGTPTKIYFSKETHRKWLALYEARVRNWANVDLTMSRGMIGGRQVVSATNSKAPYYRYNLAEKQVYFSAYHISSDNYEDYLKGIIENKCEYMVGYAKSNYFLADLFVKNNIQVPNIKAVLTSSEMLTQEMRDTFYKAYGCKTFDAYSGIEACGLISENEYGDFLFSPDSGILEVINNDGTPCKEGEEGEIISTGFLNYDQPLIRYRIGDRLKLSKDQTTKSGLQMTKIDYISGRTEDTIITKDGRKIISLYKLFIGVIGLKLSQVIQHSYTDFEIKIVVDDNFTNAGEEIIIQRFHEKVDTNVNLKITRVSDIPKTKAGKYKLTISLLDD